MNIYMEGVFALIGRYIVISVIIAGILIIGEHDVPFWCAFPLATIGMILRGHLRGGPSAHVHTTETDHDIDTHV